MTKKVYLASVGTRSGKSVLSLGLAMNYPGKVGFYKPFRESLVVKDGQPMDQDAILMASVLKLPEAEKLSPFVYDMYDPIPMDRIVKGYEEVREGNEFMIVEGSRDLANGYSCGISSFDIAKAVDAPIVLVSSTTQQSLETAFLFKEICEKRDLELKGVVINMCSGTKERDFLEDRGMTVIGGIPTIPQISTFHVIEITEIIPSKVLAGRNGLDNIVEDVLVGAMSPQVAMRYMRRSKQKAVITGGDRTEIMLAALSTNTSCIVVTGGITPSRMVTSRAEEIGVPIIMTEEDTLTVVEALEHLIARINPDDDEKIELITRGIRKGLDLDMIW
jgi:BioD-like phosphotransacetylase family protein